MIKKCKLVFFYTLLCNLFFSSVFVKNLIAQQAHLPLQDGPKSIAQIAQEIEGLKTFGRVMYLAAHPDDENQRLITYFSKQRHFKTAYLSLTRGDGGQNLIGTEIREDLGIIRTHELLAARKTDGGEQHFTRAIDFGYSKTAEETLKLWNKNQILGDVVKKIRQFKPDIIVLRFPPNSKAGHGHHTSSALLALEAFDIVGDESKYNEHIKQGIETWQPKRIYVNTGRWWNPNINDNSEKVIKINVDNYSPLIGLSNVQIAALSRSNHKSQGFGAIMRPNNSWEYLEHQKGELATKDPFEKIDISYKRFTDNHTIGKLSKSIFDNFNFKNPRLSLPALFQLKKLYEKEKEYQGWRASKLKDINTIIKDIIGLYVEAIVDKSSYTLDETMDIKLHLTNRSDLPISLLQIGYYKNISGKFSLKVLETKITKLKKGEENTKDYSVPVKSLSNTPSTQPYWLKKKHNGFSFSVGEHDLDTPINKYPFHLNIKLTVNKKDTLEYKVPVYNIIRDPVKGKVVKPVAIVPKVAVNFDKDILIFSDNKSKIITVKIRSYSAMKNLQLYVNTDKGWKIDYDKSQKISLNTHEEITLDLTITPPKKTITSSLALSIKDGQGNVFSKSTYHINYDHIPSLILTKPSSIKLVKVDLKKLDTKIGYVMGAGDEIPKYLRIAGYDVTVLPADASLQTLKKYETIIFGIRVLNKIESIDLYMKTYFQYVNEGGNMIVQYNTSRGLKTQQIGPYEIKLSRERVTDEASDVLFINPSHSVLNFPNKISQSDFKGWVQERGLYFANKWAKEYETILSWKDAHEKKNLEGGLLIASYGKGHFTYTGISFFRELPAGVPGAYRLLSNIISLYEEE